MTFLDKQSSPLIPISASQPKHVNLSTMVDVDRPMAGLNPAHLAALRRLSARAAAPTTTSSPHRKSALSFSSLSQTVTSHLQNSGIPIQPGLYDSEFARVEAEFNFSFPPDLRAFLSSGLPVGPTFPDWRSRNLIRTSLHIPIAAVTVQITRNSLWPKCWGPRPSDLKQALRIGRYALRRAPLLIPLFDRCYIPCNPSLAGNPIFFIDENRIFCCGLDLADFFEKESVTGRTSVSETKGKTARWIEFWSDVAVDRRRWRNPDRVFEKNRAVFRPILPKWVGGYLERIGSVLREGGWEEADVEEIVHVSGSGFLEEEVVLVDRQVVLDLLVLKAERFSDKLRRAGWRSEDVCEALEFDFWPEKKRKPSKKLSPEMVERIERLVQYVAMK